MTSAKTTHLTPAGFGGFPWRPTFSYHGPMKNKIAIFGLLLMVLVPSAHARQRYGTYYGFGGYDEEQDEYLRHARPRSPLYPNGIIRPVFDTPYPIVGCETRAKAYIFDRSYDRNAAYCRGWKNGTFGISLNGIMR